MKIPANMEIVLPPFRIVRNGLGKYRVEKFRHKYYGDHEAWDYFEMADTPFETRFLCIAKLVKWWWMREETKKILRKKLAETWKAVK